MNTNTRLYTALMLCVLVLTLNVIAVVEGFYVRPESKVAETALQGVCPVAAGYKPDMYGTSADYRAVRLPGTIPDLEC